MYSSVLDVTRRSTSIIRRTLTSKKYTVNNKTVSSNSKRKRKHTRAGQTSTQ
jgi:hypothetical protein